MAKVKSAGRFGARYGTRVKRKLIKIEVKQRKKQTCPFCEGTAKRVASGIWSCKKCKKKFAGHTYYLDKTSINEKIIKNSKQKALNEKLKKQETKETKEKKLVKKPTKKQTKGKMKRQETVGVLRKPKLIKPKKSK